MLQHQEAAPPTPWSKNLALPKIDDTAYVHSFSNIIGDVRIGANVLVAPGTSIRADEGTPFFIGAGSNIQDGVVIHGLEQGRVVGDDQNSYSVWIGKNVSITHKALVHGPCYIGDDCFIGFRSTVFNARIGEGCIVMLHALIQDVEIAPGKYVPSGAIITNQQQADRLPDVLSDDMEFAHHVVGINESLRQGYLCAGKVSCITPIRNEMKNYTPNGNGNGYKTSVATGSLSPDVIAQVKQLVSQGYHIGTEHADARRFKTGSWHTCSPIQSKNSSEVVAALEACMEEHAGEYVRLFGIDPKAKRRISPIMIQRADGKKVAEKSTTAAYSAPVVSHGQGASANTTGLTPEVADQVRSLVSQGYKIGTEYANERRFKTSSWQNGPTISETSASQVLSAIEQILAEHTGEYVRLIGVDSKAKRRVVETLIQQPNDRPIQQSSATVSPTSQPTVSSKGGAIATGLSQEVVGQVRSLLNQGYRISLEHANERHFKTSSWKSGAPISATTPAQAMAELEKALAEHSGEYVRLIGIDPNAKRRVMETLIQQPNGKGKGFAPTKTASEPVSKSSQPAPVYSSQTATSSSHKLSKEVVEQIRSLIAGGYKIGTEYADQRRFRTSSWKTDAQIDAKRDADVFPVLEESLAQHEGEYVRLIGIDPQAKRRVLEMIIQQPNGKAK